MSSRFRYQEGESLTTRPSRRRLQELLDYLTEEIILDLCLISDEEIDRFQEQLEARIPFLQKKKRPFIWKFLQKTDVDQKLFLIHRSLQLIVAQQHLVRSLSSLLLQIPNLTDPMILKMYQEIFPKQYSHRMFLNRYLKTPMLLTQDPPCPNLEKVLLPWKMAQEKNTPDQSSSNLELLKSTLGDLIQQTTPYLYLNYLLRMFSQLLERF